MAHSQWHRFYTSKVAAPPGLLFALLSDMPNYDRWLPPSGQFARTTDVGPYPVQLGSRYHDGKPGEPGRDWWGTVTGFQRPGSIDFHHTIEVRQLRATVDVHIHYSFEQEQARVTEIGVLRGQRLGGPVGPAAEAAVGARVIEPLGEAVAKSRKGTDCFRHWPMMPSTPVLSARARILASPDESGRSQASGVGPGVGQGAVLPRRGLTAR